MAVVTWEAGFHLIRPGLGKHEPEVAHSGHLKSNLRHKNREQARRTPALLINCPFDLSIKGRKKFLSSLIMNICRPGIIVFTTFDYN